MTGDEIRCDLIEIAEGVKEVFLGGEIEADLVPLPGVIRRAVEGEEGRDGALGQRLKCALRKSGDLPP